MTFKLGDKKPAASGRKRGTPNRQTELVRAGVKSAIEICREGGEDPISIMVNAARFLHTVATAYAPRSKDGTDLREIVSAMSREELEFMRRFLTDAATIAHKAAEFGHAKLARIDYVGDRPQGPARVENTFEFVLNIGAEQPGRPVNVTNAIAGPPEIIEPSARNGGGASPAIDIDIDAGTQDTEDAEILGG
jgi:hypothetical protein